MCKKPTLAVLSFFVGLGGLFAQFGPITPGCIPDILSTEPFFFGTVTIDGVPADVTLDSIAVFDENNRLIIKDKIRNVTANNVSAIGFGVQLRTATMACPGYSTSQPITLVLFDGSASPCRYFTSPTGSFVVTTTNFPPNVVNGPDGMGNIVDNYDFLSVNCVETIFPVEWTAFRATLTQNNHVKLDWGTESER
ncbi:MAG: hypothetical protein HC821_06005, partial [Lewinella sp.]|nr:hypothetical protein [Lewinella sp.]